MGFYDSMTRFEKTRIISARALQISMGAPILVKCKVFSPKEIAIAEFDADVLPITVKRPKIADSDLRNLTM
ncbi:MAG: DNA-directed RNA polymerase subunit K [Candidatus Aenigmarchaeota archaeon]|nr:DNA-directed RNA polymerase subunit K [Candidatus Aenigmarchaeota archaeon]